MQFRIDEITVPADRPRALDEAVVAGLVESIGAIGLQCHPTVRQTVGGDVVLVCGAHRIAALQRLGIETIECTVFSGSEQAAMMWTIAENLHRGELSAIERAQHIQRWLQLARESGLSGRKAEAAIGADHAGVWRSAKIVSLPAETQQRAQKEKWSEVRLLRAARGETPGAAAEKPAAAPIGSSAPRGTKRGIARQQNRDRIGEIREWLASRLTAAELHELSGLLSGLCDERLVRALTAAAA